ncbi:DDE-type integrase/transposase/recombinase [Anaerosporobacter faecicola]|uniref:DDE-type integrase/transposase/recombinase n=1 Tax=Anaerosporobacter faecicola TaxID=2718714 RepID=UPI001EE51C0B|nr:DDE-type integrase/transposase/recombinase [Anaerosporobacter faecicola]
MWVSAFTYLKAVGKWYYLCIVIDLFSHKVIAWNISSKPAVDLVMTTYEKSYDKRNYPVMLMFHSD